MSSNYNPPNSHQSSTPTPLQSFTKSFVSFGKALILFFLVTHVYMILFFVIPNQGSGSEPTKVQVVVSSNTTKSESETSVTPPNTVELPSIVVTKEKEPPKPKERPIQIQTVIVEKVRDELTQEQLQRIHSEFQNELSSSSSTSSSSSSSKTDGNKIINGNIYIQRINTLQNLLEKVTYTRNFNKQIYDKTNALLQNSQPSKLFDPKVQSLMKTSMHRLVASNPMDGGERKVAQMKAKYDEEQIQKIKIDSLVTFLQRDMNYRDMDVDQLKDEVLKPIEEEFERLLEMYGNGDFSINDIRNVFAKHGINLNNYYENKCDRNYLKIDYDLYGPIESEEVNEEMEEKNEIEEKEEEEEEQEDDPEDGMYATKNYLSNYIGTVMEDLEKHFSEANESLSIFIRNKNQLTLKEKAFETLRQRFNHASQTTKSKFDTFSLKLRNFITSIENYKNLGIPNNVPYDEEELCTQVDEVEDIVMFAVKYVERLGMEVDDAIKLIIENFNLQNDEEYHVDYEEINPLPEIAQPEFLNNVVERRETFKELMNTPMVHASIKSLNQGIDIISGYNDALDRLIDFIAGFSKSDNNGDGHEEGTFGESIETALVRLLNNFNMPTQMSDKHGKAGILR